MTSASISIKVVASWSDSYMGDLVILKYASIKLRGWCSVVESSSWSIFSRGSYPLSKLCLGCEGPCKLSIFIFLWDYYHVGYPSLVSYWLYKTALEYPLYFFHDDLALSALEGRFFCFTCITVWWRSSRWQSIWGSMPNMSVYDHAKTSWFLARQLTSSPFSLMLSSFATLINHSGQPSIAMSSQLLLSIAGSMHNFIPLTIIRFVTLSRFSWALAVTKRQDRLRAWHPWPSSFLLSPHSGVAA